MMPKKKEEKSIQRSFLEGGTKYPQKVIQRQSVEQSLRERPSETTPPIDPSHIQFQSPDTIMDAHKYVLSGAGYSCHLGGSASA